MLAICIEGVEGGGGGGEGGKWVGVRHLLAFHVIRSFQSKIRLAVMNI